LIVQLFIAPSKFTKIDVLLKSLTTKTCRKIHDWLSILIISLQLTLMNFIVWMAIFVVAKTTLFMHPTMPQPLVYVQWFLRLFSTFQNGNNPCMFSKLEMGPHNSKRCKRVMNCNFLFLFNLKVRLPNNLARTNYVTNLHSTMFRDK